jgi:hypothetical protein
MSNTLLADDERVLMIDVGHGMLAYGKLHPETFHRLQVDCLVGRFHAKLLEGLEVADEWLQSQGMTQILQMTSEDHNFRGDPPSGWLLCRMKDVDNG